MGYDLRITRNVHAAEEGPEISRDEWLAVIAGDEELSLEKEDTGGDFVGANWKGEGGVLWWNGGDIVSKYPEAPLIVKMVQIARRLNAQVQGDDGEIYGEDGTPVEPEGPAIPTAAPGIFTRIGKWFTHRKIVRELHKDAPAFSVGQRVIDPWGNKGTVVEVNRKANSGLGRIRVKTDRGTEQVQAYVATVWKIDKG